MQLAEEKKDPEDEEEASGREDEEPRAGSEEEEELTRWEKNVQIAENMFIMQSVEDMVCESIARVESPEARKKLAASVLLVGGLARTREPRDLVDQLEERLIEKIGSIDDKIEMVEVVVNAQKGTDPRYYSWIGGSVIPKLEAAKEMFILRDRWTGDVPASFEKHL